MSARIVRAPMAITVEGDVLLNVVSFEVPLRVERLVELAARLRGAVFVGILLDQREADIVREDLRHAARDSAARIAGRRQKRERK
jgi:hypothetical protein